jgi:MIP family channel proteins
MKTTFAQALGAEFLGTLALVLFCTGAVVVNEQTQALGHGGLAATCGLVVLVLIQAFGPTSGAHFNPAVTVGFWAAGRFAGRQVGPYVLTQLLGALAGSGLVRLLATGPSALGATLPAHGAGPALGVETGLTFWLMLVVLRVAHGSKEQGLLAGLTIGAMVGLEVLVGGPLSGGSMNPVRSLAPALVGGHLTAAWVYITGPLAGALLAVLANKLLNISHLPNDEPAV